ncbi:MAG: hypothetical protein QW507_01920 [Candidatus Nanoarchaeia archaeon]|nr:hypothetical protein [Candidatus Haiyanarchaeum thermophilum]MCW1302828.1 hypothetical protein [Candidatus Haiyanarchaeum thermophilum]MCW1303509.1 hypothetical protein [Candidatus Haiyanarchaeum thermophilum]MCW1306689.1 hypothetical protein [Candidatus Haiyanarchaeum thermophilum]MCW1307355.1 hypothetical protein [Candidatus Haiyanarchaeum thermophilum]
MLIELEVRKFIHRILRRREIHLILLLISLSIASGYLVSVLSYTITFKFNFHRPIGFTILESSTHPNNFSINRGEIFAYSGDTITINLNVTNRANNDLNATLKIYCSSSNSSFRLENGINFSAKIAETELNLKFIENCTAQMCFQSDPITLRRKSSYLLNLNLFSTPALYPSTYECQFQFETP